MPRGPLLAAALVVTSAAMAAMVTAPDQQQPAFRAGTQTVALYATVVDRYGGPILNLTRDDFVVLDDGKPQPLTVFVAGLQPISAVLLVDTSASMTLNLDLEKTAAEQFIIRMLPGDQARIGTFSNRIELGPGFSMDRDAILRTFRSGLDFGNTTRLWDALDETMTALRPLGGRRVIMLLTDGMDTASKHREAELLERARGDELMIYIVQFRSSPRANLAEVSLSPSPSELFSSDGRVRTRPPTELLRRLARQTGGGHFVLGPFDDVNATFTAVMGELHYQYVLGFTPLKSDGKVHAIEIRTRRPNLVVRARQSYLAPKP